MNLTPQVVNGAVAIVGDGEVEGLNGQSWVVFAEGPANAVGAPTRTVDVDVEDRGKAATHISADILNRVGVH